LIQPSSKRCANAPPLCGTSMEEEARRALTKAGELKRQAAT
jgi:hypothetical protein